MKTESDALDMLYASGAPSATFLEVGTKHEGRIISVEKVQQRDLKTKQPKFWEDGNPMWQLVFTIETEERDETIDDDDGQRRIFAKAQMLGAIRDAIRSTGHKGDPVGGTLGVKYVKDGAATTPGFNPPKVYAAKFEPPTAMDDPDLGPDEEYGDEPF